MSPKNIDIPLQEALLMNQEKPLVNSYHHTWAETEGKTYKIRSIFKSKLNHNAPYFNIWGGYYRAFQCKKSHIKTDDRLMIINYATGGDVPFIYPLIKDRKEGRLDGSDLIYAQSKDENDIKIY